MLGRCMETVSRMRAFSTAVQRGFCCDIAIAPKRFIENVGTLIDLLHLQKNTKDGTSSTVGGGTGM